MDFAEQSLPINFLIFALGAAGVWIAGAKLSGYVDEYADRTGLGKAFAGALILGGATSLPELATTLTASYTGAARLSGANLLGGVAMQISVLAVVDAFVLRGKPLTFFSPKSTLLMVGVMLMCLIALASAAIACGELWSVGSVGTWPVLMFLAYLASLRTIYKYEGDPRWEPHGEVAEPPESTADMKDVHHQAFADMTTKTIVVRFVVACIVVLIGGFLVARTGEAIALQTGIGQDFIGATLVAVATSLPEVSTTFAAVRFGAYSMAAANILGTNSLAIAMFLPADIAYREGSIIDAMEPSACFLASLGIITTGLYLWGILERRNRTIFGMGYDSLWVLCVYLVGISLYYVI